MARLALAALLGRRLTLHAIPGRRRGTIHPSLISRACHGGSLLGASLSP